MKNIRVKNTEIIIFKGICVSGSDINTIILLTYK